MTILTEHGYGKSHKGNIWINTFGANLTQGGSYTKYTRGNYSCVHSVNSCLSTRYARRLQSGACGSGDRAEMLTPGGPTWASVNWSGIRWLSLSKNKMHGQVVLTKVWYWRPKTGSCGRLVHAELGYLQTGVTGVVPWAHTESWTGKANQVGGLWGADFTWGPLLLRDRRRNFVCVCPLLLEHGSGHQHVLALTAGQTGDCTTLQGIIFIGGTVHSHLNGGRWQQTILFHTNQHIVTIFQ